MYLVPNIWIGNDYEVSGGCGVGNPEIDEYDTLGDAIIKYVKGYRINEQYGPGIIDKENRVIFLDLCQGDERKKECLVTITEMYEMDITDYVIAYVDFDKEYERLNA